MDPIVLVIAVAAVALIAIGVFQRMRSGDTSPGTTTNPTADASRGAMADDVGHHGGLVGSHHGAHHHGLDDGGASDAGGGDGGGGDGGD